jgi:hypothetical protein
MTYCKAMILFTEFGLIAIGVVLVGLAIISKN